MTVIEQIQNLFKPKNKLPPDSMDMSSVGLPVDPFATGVMNSADVPVAQDFSSNAASRQQENEKASYAPSALFSDTNDSEPENPDLLKLPILGNKTVAQHQRTLLILLGVSVLVLAVVAYRALNQAGVVTQQISVTGGSLMQSQRLAKSVSQALVGSAPAFADVKESAGSLAKDVRGLKSGDDAAGLAAVAAELQPNIDKVMPLMERAEKNAAAVMGQQAILTQVGAALRTINRQSSDLLEIAETVSSLKLQQNAAPAEISASGQLVMLTQRIGKSANEFLTLEGVSPEAVFLLGKDLNSFKEIAQGLQEGSPELRLAGSKDPQTRERLEALMALYEQTRVQAGAILGNLQGLVSAREAQASIISDSEPLRRNLEELQANLSKQAGLSFVSVAALGQVRVAGAGGKCPGFCRREGKRGYFGKGRSWAEVG